MGYWDEFKKFLNQGNFVTLAVAFVMGAALNSVVQALVADIITPLIGAVFKYNLAAATLNLNGSVFAYGDLLNKIIGFVIDALVVFFAIVVPMEKVQARQAAKLAALPPTTKTCPQCRTTVPVAATRCSACTQPLPATSS